MERIQPGHEVLSLFGINIKNEALNKANYRLVISLISAFFIVLVISLILGVATKVLEKSPSAAAAGILEEEKVAFTPGQFISEKIRQGYMDIR